MRAGVNALALERRDWDSELVGGHHNLLELPASHVRHTNASDLPLRDQVSHREQPLLDISPSIPGVSLVPAQGVRARMLQSSRK
jgi:hypothetical protein